IDYRAKKNLTLRALATLIGGITGATLGNIERGSTWPRRLTICKLERFLRRQGVFDGGRR
ncbi:MAG: helix-turn-helix domain-containing protein, partial [Burkholderiales bacterium]